MLLCSQPDTVRRFPLRETRLQHLLCSAPTIYGFFSVAFYERFVKKNICGLNPFKSAALCRLLRKPPGRLSVTETKLHFG